MNEPFPPPPPDVKRLNSAGTAQALGTPMNFRSPGRQRDPAADSGGDQVASDGAQSRPAAAKKQATETLAQRAGALSDEIDFADFVSSLIHGTFDAIVDTSIRQMEAYAHLVSAVSKSVEQFTDDNVTLNQARDWLVQQFPQDLYLDLSGPPKVLPKPLAGEDGVQTRSPEWLREFQLDGEDLTGELIEDQLVPKARSKVGQGRQQMLATMVLLGLNRVSFAMALSQRIFASGQPRRISQKWNMQFLTIRKGKRVGAAEAAPAIRCRRPKSPRWE